MSKTKIKNIYEMRQNKAGEWCLYDNLNKVVMLRHSDKATVSMMMLKMYRDLSIAVHAVPDVSRETIRINVFFRFGKHSFKYRVKGIPAKNIVPILK